MSAALGRTWRRGDNHRNGASGLMGFGLALGFIHAGAVALGSWLALGLGLAICVGWNLALMRLARRAR
jgi:hypothetical protein